MTKIIILGSGGQLGKELLKTAPADPNMDIIGYSRNQLDITDNSGLDKLRAAMPDQVINASAYTKVDLAESEAELADLVNHTAIERLAATCEQSGARLVHVSTDFVFDGKQSTPYRPEDATNPLSVYGRSKLRGEAAVRACKNLDSVILRTAWVYSSNGQNFVKTMLKLFNERSSLNVVFDQIGSPTWAHNLARVIWQLISHSDITGTYHYTDAGVTSWYDFAVAIQEEAHQLGFRGKTCKIAPILSEAYPTPAVRPHFSVLDCSSLEHALGIERPHWRASLREMLKEL